MANGHGKNCSKRSNAMREEDFDENEVLSCVKEKEGSRTLMRRGFKECSSSPPKMIPRGQEKEPMMVRQSSAPMNIPDWSKIYRKINGHGHSDGHDDGDDDGGLAPPHEWLARKLARSRISSFSMCEGIGRTLKGRDLSRVRDAVLTKTGFLE